MTETRRPPRRWAWGVSLLAAATLAATAVVSTVEEMAYRPVLLDASAGPPRDPADGVNLSTGTTVTQALSPAAWAMREPEDRNDEIPPFVTDLVLFVTDFRGAPEDATLTATVEDGDAEVASETVRLTERRPDGSLRFAVDRALPADRTFTLRVRVDGVERRRSPTLWVQPDSALGGSASVIRAGTAQAVTGHVAFRLERHPTRAAVWDTVRRDAVFGAAVAAAAIVTALAAIPRARRRVHALLDRDLLLPRPPRVSARELCAAVIVGCVLAITLTLPFYVSPDRMSTEDDIHRPLVYRAVARASLLDEKRMGLWEPYVCGGKPLLANSESAQLDPFFFLLVLPFGETLGTRLTVTGVLIIGFVGAYLLSRRVLRADAIPALLSGTVWLYGSSVLAGALWSTYTRIPLAWIPWALVLFWESQRRVALAAVAGVTLAFMLGGGSSHVFLFSALAIAAAAIVLAILVRHPKPLATALLAGAAALSLSAVKLVPALSFQALASSFHRPAAAATPLSAFPRMLLDRSQLHPNPPFPDASGQTTIGWDEYAAYIGIIPVLLVLASLARSRDRNHRVVLAVSGFFFLLLFSLPPWERIASLPLASELLRTPQRSRIVLFLLLGALAASGLSVITRRIAARRGVRATVAALAVAAVAADLVTLHRPVYERVYHLPPPDLSGATDRFVRFDAAYRTPDLTYYEAAYGSFLLRRGMTDACLPDQETLPQNARGIDASNPLKPYRGEAWLVRAGTTHDADVGVNTVRVSLAPHDADILAINQNFFPGWRTDPPRDVVQHAGVVAAVIAPDDEEITFTYAPMAYTVGRALSVGAILVLLPGMAPAFRAGARVLRAFPSSPPRRTLAGDDPRAPASRRLRPASVAPPRRPPDSLRPVPRRAGGVPPPRAGPLG